MHNSVDLLYIFIYKIFTVGKKNDILYFLKQLFVFRYTTRTLHCIGYVHNYNH